LPFALACNYIRQAALGLQHAHQEGLVHRDIKPENLVVTASGVVKLLDLGLARVDRLSLSGTSLDRLTQQGVVMGTPDYMAPEQWQDPHQADHCADLYSLGCTFYFLLAGQPPYGGANLMEKMLFHHQGTPRSLHEFRQDLPEELEPIVQRMLAKAPEDRF